MRKELLAVVGLLLCAVVSGQTGWKIVPGKITTAWSVNINPDKVLPEYPRPQMVREDWSNLNGLWQYTIVPAGDTRSFPESYEGNILVPFAVESALSGVGRTVGKDSVLWYRRTVPVSAAGGKRVLLHFGAVDWQTDVFINGKAAGSHKGGYDPFSFDITDQLKPGNEQEIVVRVWDPSDEGPQPRGKQVKNPRGIWYTPITGIWQTVWMESVPATYISSFTQTPDIDNQRLTVSVAAAQLKPGDEITVVATDNGKQIASQKTGPSNTVTLPVINPRLWSPDHPFLYDLRIRITRKGRLVDEVRSYFAMRKISVSKDRQGVQRLMLNNAFLFQYGPLDQGWWPDGLYTAPSDEALTYDIVKTKEMGFNMIRKHVKVEPARWYNWCDKLGILVWQDMPSGDMGNQWEMRPGIYGKATDKDRTAASEAIYRTEWKEIMQDLAHFPSIVIWTPFNEAWGQFKTREITEWTMRKDPSRLVNTASGGNFVEVGPIIDLHNYPDPLMPDADLYGARRALVLGEFGGLGLPIEGHTWQTKNNWGYQSFRNTDELFARYQQFITRMPHLISKGLSAAVYTQTTDVETEINGLITYDRRQVKMDAAKLRALHQALYVSGGNGK
ncbi:glycoside hydrolase family 2 protein [Sediminibacterium soli]|uniref:glycoside hydrolase family 2 protein n=1 Tax=Sediminibacterium soli TaxID=2698829 RepID=UPI001379C413|nr:sugar-binding domain-containing protein [Sediminibacterium soli]NCI48199.1 beta-galactosidase [Sediminibacterium soli]